MNEFLFQHYLVVFLDILGQKEALRKIKDLPNSEAEQDYFLGLIKDSFGKVLRLRDHFNHLMQGFKNQIPDITLVPPEFREQFQLSTKAPDVSFYSLSDAMVIAVPLINDNENCTAMNGVYEALMATSGIALMYLSIGVPIRAGIDVGIAAQIDKQEIYGPALERAYFLESHLAEYPRCLVGMELLSYLKYVEKQDATSTLGIIAKNMAQYCREMLVQDTDGRIMLDFLGKKVKESSKEAIDKEIVQRAWDYVNTQFENYFAQDNEIIKSRYFRLLRYFKSRKSIWGI